MNKPFLVCGFYTIGTPYEQEIQGLVESCKKLNIPCEIVGYDARGSWVRNCAIKPEFIYEMLVKHPDSNIVYIDADGKVQQYPKLFDEITEDIGVHLRNGTELLSGTIFFKNTPDVQLLVRAWIQYQSMAPTEWDQKVLHRTIQKHVTEFRLKVYNLPPTYVQIFDSMRGCGVPVIEHFQASRRFKRVVITEEKRGIPKIMYNQRVRLMPDGSFVLPRANDMIKKELAEKYNKFPNENRWYPRTNGAVLLENLKPFFMDKPCYIVGKGPSLDKLLAKDFDNPTAPVICINESIHKIETLGLRNPLFMMQQDAPLKNTCKPSKPETILLLGHACQHWYEKETNKFIFHFIEIGLIKHMISVVYALALAKTCGCTSYKLFAFDAAVTQNIDYAASVGYKPTKGGNPIRFLGHRSTILKYSHGLPLEFFMPLRE